MSQLQLFLAAQTHNDVILSSHSLPQ